MQACTAVTCVGRRDIMLVVNRQTVTGCQLTTTATGDVDSSRLVSHMTGPAGTDTTRPRDNEDSFVVSRGRKLDKGLVSSADRCVVKLVSHSSNKGDHPLPVNIDCPSAIPVPVSGPGGVSRSSLLVCTSWPPDGAKPTPFDTAASLAPDDARMSSRNGFVVDRMPISGGNSPNFPPSRNGQVPE